ncbi:MAG TPA: YcxB family protein [Verrucomicrobiae bacterium]
MTPPPLPTSIRYTLTRSDLISLRMGSIWRNRFVRYFYPIFFVVIFALNFNNEEVRNDPRARRITVATLEAGVPCVIGLAFTIGVAIFGAYRKNPGVLCEHEIQLTDYGLIERTDVNQTVHRWPGIGRIRRTAEFLLIYTGESQFLAIPNTAFPSVQALDSFEAELRQKSTGAGAVAVTR